MWKVHSVMCEYVAKWRACFIYWSVWSNKLETLHIRLQFAYLLKCFAFFLLLTLPSLRNNPTAEQPHFFWASFICWHQWICTTDECGCFCLILVMMAAVRLDRELKNPIICHHVSLPNRVFVKIVTLGGQHCGAHSRPQPSAQIQHNGAKLLLAFSCWWVLKSQTERWNKLGRENTLTRKKAASKQFWICLRQETW